MTRLGELAWIAREMFEHMQQRALSRAIVQNRRSARKIVEMAEGEELGSNLLRVAKSGLWGPGGPPRGTRSRPEREMAERVPNGSAGRPSG